MVEDDKSTYIFYGLLFAGKKFDPPFSRPNARYRLVRFLPQKVYNILIRRLQVPPVDILTGYKPDLAIFTNYVHPPLAFNEKSLTFVYDLSYITHGEMADTKNAQLLRKRVPYALRRSSAIITISENSKKDIIEHYGTSSDKIHIVHPALDHNEYYPRSLADQKNVAKKFGIIGKYLLFTGTIEPRKNIIGILEAYRMLPRAVRNQYTLVLAGGKGWNDQDIYNKLEELKDEKIIVTGYVDDEDMPSLYSGASVFVFPTFYEGWGMPVVEAMACGTPVISSDNSSMPEAGGDAALYIIAEDTRAITRQIERVLSDKKLTETMIKKGIAHAAKFSWQKSAQDLKKIIDQVLAQ